MSKTLLFSDLDLGVHIVFVDRPNGESEVRVTTTPSVSPFGQLTMTLDLDDVDRLLAVIDNAENPEHDLAEFFVGVFHATERGAANAARAFVQSAGSLAETIR